MKGSAIWDVSKERMVTDYESEYGFTFTDRN